MSVLGESRLAGEFVAFMGDMLIDREKPVEALRPVLLIPGFMASDLTLYPLGARLRRLGCRVFYGGIWSNSHCPAVTMDRLQKALNDASRRADSKVVAIGQSLGGIYARELARRTPDLVERAILLGTPILHPADNLSMAVSAMTTLMQISHRCCMAAAFPDVEDARRAELPRTPPEVPETIIYSRTDGVVDWRSCIEHGPRVEAVEVVSSHVGMAFNVQAWRAIKARLSGPAHNSKPHNFARAYVSIPNLRPFHF